MKEKKITIVHQFAKKPFFFPTWKIKHLFIGTFNPGTGMKVPYYYGRPKNKMWAILSHVFRDSLQVTDEDFLDKLKKHGIGCVDMIRSVEILEAKSSFVSGRGYSDSKIINGYSTREYNTKGIISLIIANPGVKVYSTWGKGSTLIEWNTEVNKLPTFCRLVSPSMAAKVPAGNNKFDYMVGKWSMEISPI